MQISIWTTICVDKGLYWRIYEDAAGDVGHLAYHDDHKDPDDDGYHGDHDGGGRVENGMASAGEG